MRGIDNMTGMKQQVTVLGIKKWIGTIDGKNIESLKADVYDKQPYPAEETRLGYPVTTFKITDMSVYAKFLGQSFPCECEAVLEINKDKIVFTDLTPMHQLELKQVKEAK